MMAVNTKQLTPAFAIHPGEILKDELAARQVTQKDFAQLTGIPQTQLNEIIKGKRGIYADTALIIGKALKMDAVLWTNLQMNYELDKARIDEKNKARLAAIDIWQMIYAYIPVKFFKKEGILSGNPIQDIPVVKEIYNISNVEQLASLYSQTNYARFRKSDKLSIDKVNLVGWVKLVSHKAAMIKVSQFDSKNESELVKSLNEVFRKNKKAIEKTQAILAGYGIKLVIQTHPEKCAVDGISFWSNGNPAIGMTVRHKRIDNFAFTVLHELGHVFKHLVNNNTAEFIDLDKDHNDTEYKNSREEKEADEFARNGMINKNAWRFFMQQTPVFDEAAITAFATKNKVHPAIVQGRFLFETECFNVRSSISKIIE
jgi:HTH-type transcriptional regulator/antitoxin HigA